MIVEVIDRKGRVGLGECTAFDTDWYLPETLGDDLRVLRDVLAPRVIAGTYLHPREVAADLFSLEGAEAFPMAVSALEMACWDLYGKVTEKPLWKLLGEEFDRMNRVAAALEGDDAAVALAHSGDRRGATRKVYSGAVVGLGTPAQTVAEVRECVDAGYQRIKLKVAPGRGLPAVRAVRRAFPHLLITLDANQSFGLHNLAELRSYDELDIGWIEEPLNLAAAGGERALRDPFTRLASFQHTLAMPICVDESFVNAEEAAGLFEHPELRCAMVKIGKFGGIEPVARLRAPSAGRGPRGLHERHVRYRRVAVCPRGLPNAARSGHPRRSGRHGALLRRRPHGACLYRPRRHHHAERPGPRDGHRLLAECRSGGRRSAASLCHRVGADAPGSSGRPSP